MKKSIGWLCLLLSLLIPTFLVTNFTLNHFYVDGILDGGVVNDSGWFAYLSSHAAHWPMPNPPILGGTFFDMHMSFIFYLCTVIHFLLTKIGITIPAPIFFSVIHGLTYGLLSLAAYGLFLPPKQKRSMIYYGVALLYSLLVMGNGVSLGAVVHPHFEIGIPACLFAFFALWTNHYRKLCYLPLIIGLITREDAGLHYFGAFILLALTCRFLTNESKLKHFAKYFFQLSTVCFLYASFILIFQKLLFNPQIMGNLYTGHPLYHYVNWSFIKERFYFIAHYRPYIYVPLLILAALAYLRRNFLLLIGVLTVLPWIIFSFFATQPPSGAPIPGSMKFYYAFPIIIALLWPSIVYGMAKMTENSKQSYAAYWWDASIVIGASTLMFCLSVGSPHDVPYPGYHYPWKSFGMQWRNHCINNQITLDAILTRHQLGSYFLVDNAVAALEFDKLNANNRYPNTLGVMGAENERAKPNMEKVDILVFFPGPHRSEKARGMIKLLHLNDICSLAGTSFMIAKKPKTHLEWCA